MMNTNKNRTLKPWQTKEWKEKRRSFIKGKSCEWYSSEEDLVLHHHKHFYDNKEYPQIAFDFFLKKGS